ncbi:hypothetical protein BD779DRAFT_1438744 [Infundibulicybe gibba]|nr:hypothetical protein BD779DRAFT_1438744 [Infundibulicybe gibba]
MSDFTLVDPKGWEWDLHSVYSAYIGYFQVNNIPWYERSWGHLFSSFEEFLAFSWPVITVTDAFTGRAHIVTRLTSIGAFIKMMKTRFGETLPQAPNILQVVPFETATRHLRNVSDYPSYKKLHSTLPAAILAALKIRVRAGEPNAVLNLWAKRDKTFLALDFECSERNEKSCLEWGYAAVRCGHLEAQGHWPPNPDTNYRKGHYIVAEYVDRLVNRHQPNYPWQFGDSQMTPKAKLPQIIQAVIRHVLSSYSETTPNTLVLVAQNASNDLARLDDMKIKLPHNVLVVDLTTLERILFSSGHRGPITDPRTGQPRAPGSTLPFDALLRTLSFSSSPAPSPGTEAPPVLLPHCILHNAGNDAMMLLFALQALLDPTRMPAPTARPRPMPAAFSMPMMPMPMGMPGLSPYATLTRASSYDLAGEFGQMNINRAQARSPAPMSATLGPRTGGKRAISGGTATLGRRG